MTNKKHSVRVTQYRGSKVRGTGTVLADSPVIVSGLCGAMSVTIYGADHKHAHHVSLSMSIEDGEFMAQMILNEVARQRRLQAEKGAAA